MEGQWFRAIFSPSPSGTYLRMAFTEPVFRAEKKMDFRSRVPMCRSKRGWAKSSWPRKRLYPMA